MEPRQLSCIATPTARQRSRHMAMPRLSVSTDGDKDVSARIVYTSQKNRGLASLSTTLGGKGRSGTKQKKAYQHT